MSKETVIDVRSVTPSKAGTNKIWYRTSIPAEWIKKHKLEKGGKLLVKEDNDRLIFEKIE